MTPLQELLVEFKEFTGFESALTFVVAGVAIAYRLISARLEKTSQAILSHKLFQDLPTVLSDLGEHRRQISKIGRKE